MLVNAALRNFPSPSGQPISLVSFTFTTDQAPVVGGTLNLRRNNDESVPTTAGIITDVKVQGIFLVSPATEESPAFGSTSLTYFIEVEYFPRP